MALKARLGGYVKMVDEECRKAVGELKAEGRSNRNIAGVLGVGETTVRRATAPNGAPNDGHQDDEAPNAAPIGAPIEPVIAVGEREILAEAKRIREERARLADWRTGTGYPASDAPLGAFAWEFLRRNERYRAMWARLPAQSLAIEFGLRVPRDPDHDEMPPAEWWDDGWAPQSGLFGVLAALEGEIGGARSRVLAELRSEARFAEFRRLVARLGPLHVGNRARLVLQLRAWDGRASGASDVEIATTLFPKLTDARCYPYSTARRRARHAWQEAERFIAGRYRLLALAGLTN